ncbi:MAG: D-2-hydroxyacid dehydrogenase [Rhodospirillaceae bacterium]|nr:D-2-hydroxyacid dehydrogenase [Rhodospirillaceae bacterium]
MTPFRSLPVIVFAVAYLGVAPAFAQPAAYEVIARLGLEESEVAARDMPGWTPPGAVIVMVDGPDRLDWYREVLPDAVALLPARSDTEAAQLAAENADTVRAVVGFCNADIVRAGPNIHWLHMPFAGVARCVSIPSVAEGGYVITNMQRLAGPQIAEHVMAMMLYFARGLDHYTAAQAEKKWDRFAASPATLWAVNTKTMLVAGLGGIGTQTARLASGLGMRVIATRNSSREGPDFVDYVGLADELPELAEQADVLVNAMPLTDSTRGVFDAAFFERMKPSALFINVGRGGSAVTEDLITALENGTIAGAALDVQDPEPVPSDHPLWEAPNLLITPHMSSFNDAGRDVFWVIFRENLRRYVAGEKMLSVVDIAKGY